MMALKNSVLSDELDRIDQSETGLTPEAVVRVAKDPDNPLHSWFEWDDAKAGHQHRISQARVLIKRVKIVTPAGSRTPKYVSVEINDSTDRRYEPLQRVVQDPSKLDFVIGEVVGSVDELSVKLEALSELKMDASQADRARSMRALCRDLKSHGDHLINP
jgi:hypothetical protein